MDTIRTMKVTGRGLLRLKPDGTRLQVTLQGVQKEYDEALRGVLLGIEKSTPKRGLFWRRHPESDRG